MNSPFRVLGIAMVVEGLGSGARLAFRYPVSAPEVDDHNENDPEHHSSRQDLFFTLPPRVIAKLFRPKKPLCGQPMTVSVGGTVFCCRAVLFEDNSNDDENNNNTSNLVMFSVIVAVLPFTHTSAIPISGWFDGEPNHLMEEHDDDGDNKDKASGRLAPSVSFRSIRRIHVSLARLCRVMEREERRCQYVSIQSSRLLKLRNDLGLNEEGAATTTTSSSANHGQPGGGAAKSSSSVVSSSNNTGAPTDGGKMRHRRLGSGTIAVPSAAEVSGGNDHHTTSDYSMHDAHQQEREQDALEIMLSEPDKDGTNDKQSQHGNLARELAQVFHAMSRSDHAFARTTMGLLSGQDGIVYINRHVAVPIESISGDSATFTSASTTSSAQPSPRASLMDYRPVIRPYHTLLFPHASPGECMEAMTVTSLCSAPRKLEQLLLMANPRKPLSDIAMDAALPVPVALELAGYLVSHGTCVVSPVLSRSSRLACRQGALKKMQGLSLDFCQMFGPHLPIFLVVSVLTSKCVTLEEIMSRVSSSVDDNEDETISLVGDKIAASLGQSRLPPGLAAVENKSRVHLSSSAAVSARRDDQGVVRIQDVEEVVYSMAVWLRSHLVIVEMKDYIVSIGKIAATDVPSNVAGGTSLGESGDKKERTAILSESVKSTNSHMERDRTNAWGSNPEEALYHELLESECLNGNISTVALCWKFGLDGRRLNRFRSWGFRQNKIRVVTRTPAPGDDWGAA